MKAPKDAYNVRDIEHYYYDYVEKVSPLLGARNIEMDVSDKRHGVSSLAPSDSIIRWRSRANKPVIDVSSASSSKRRHSSDMSIVHDLDENFKSARPRKSTL